jgi:hypothetical protein
MADDRPSRHAGDYDRDWWAGYAREHPERVGLPSYEDLPRFAPPRGLRIYETARQPDGGVSRIEYVYGPGTHTCRICLWGYTPGDTGPEDRATATACHWCQSLVQLQLAERTRLTARAMRLVNRNARIGVVVFWLLVLLGWLLLGR